MIDIDNINYKVKLDISIFYGEGVMQSEPKPVNDEPPIVLAETFSRS